MVPGEGAPEKWEVDVSPQHLVKYDLIIGKGLSKGRKISLKRGA